MVDVDYDETQEDRTDPEGVPDKDEVLPSLQQKETSETPDREVLAVPNMRVQKYRNKSEIDAILMKRDTIRKKYDLRNVDEKSINNIWLRQHIKQLKERIAAESEGKKTLGKQAT